MLINDILDDEHGKDFVEIAVSLYAAQLFPRGAIMSEDNIANFVDRLIAKQQKEKETDNDSEFQDEVESLGALIEDELRDLSVDQRIALASAGRANNCKSNSHPATRTKCRAAHPRAPDRRRKSSN